MTARTALAALLLATLLAACGDGDEPTGRAPFDGSRFPVVLEHDTRVTGLSDGSAFEAVPVVPGSALRDPAASRRVLARDGGVVIESTDGSGSVVVPGVSAESEWLNPHWSPDGAHLMFDARAGEESTLYIVDAGGTNPQALAAGLSGVAFPLAWSDDSTRLAFGVQDAGPPFTSMLYTARSDGTERAALGEFTNPQGDAGWDRPKFSSDGDKIVAFRGRSTLALRIFDTGGAPPVDVEGAAVTRFSWSPDGRAIVFDTSDAAAQRSMILIADAATGSARALTEGSTPRWSPAGDRIAFFRPLAAAESQVRTIRTDGSEDVAAGPPGYYAFGDLDWAEDGSQLSYTRPAFGAAQLFRVDLRDAIATTIGKPIGEPGNPPQAISLSPDEGVLAFLSGAYDPRGGWYLQDPNTGDSTLIAGGGFPFADIHWGDTGPVIATGGTSLTVTGGNGSRDLGLSRVFSVRFSPDGALIAASTFDGLWIVATDGATREHIVDADAEVETAQHVDWAPDGTRLTYNIMRSVGATRSFVADLDGSRTEITQSNPYGAVRWAPAGKSLAHATTPSGQAPARQIWITDHDGTGARLLASFDEPCCDTMLWSPDGAYIAVDGGDGVSIIDTATGTVTLAVTTGGPCKVQPAGWSTTSDALYVFPACYTGI